MEVVIFQVEDLGVKASVLASNHVNIHVEAPVVQTKNSLAHKPEDSRESTGWKIDSFIHSFMFI